MLNLINCRNCNHDVVCGARKAFENLVIQANCANMEGMVSIEIHCLKFSDRKQPKSKDGEKK